MPFSRVALQGFAPRSPLAVELRRHLAAGGRGGGFARTGRRWCSWRCRSTREQQHRRLHRHRAGARAAVAPALSVPGADAFGRELAPAAQLLLSRDISYSETAALAKELEEGQQYREMQDDIATQVLRRLSSLRL
jgi:LPS-assembly lipoprotein